MQSQALEGKVRYTLNNSALWLEANAHVTKSSVTGAQENVLWGTLGKAKKAVQSKAPPPQTTNLTFLAQSKERIVEPADTAVAMSIR